MKYLFFSISASVLLHFNAMAQSTDTLFIQAHITKLTHAKEYTLKVAELMPEEKYSYQPSKEEMSFGEQLLHIGDNLTWLSSTHLSKKEAPLKDTANKSPGKKKVIAWVIAAYDYAIESLQQFDLKELSTTVKFFAGPMSKLQIINLIQDHQTHHRGQILVYLRLNGIKPPAYTGW